MTPGLFSVSGNMVLGIFLLFRRGSVHENVLFAKSQRNFEKFR